MIIGSSFLLPNLCAPFSVINTPSPICVLGVSRPGIGTRGLMENTIPGSITRSLFSSSRDHPILGPISQSATSVKHHTYIRFTHQPLQYACRLLLCKKDCSQQMSCPVLPSQAVIQIIPCYIGRWIPNLLVLDDQHT